jgi:hypothetical protein
MSLMSYGTRLGYKKCGVFDVSIGNQNFWECVSIPNDAAVVSAACNFCCTTVTARSGAAVVAPTVTRALSFSSWDCSFGKCVDEFYDVVSGAAESIRS